MKLWSWALVACAILLLDIRVSALVPLTTPVQGVLRDGAGVPVADAHFGMTFTLYTGPAAEADPVWSESWPGTDGDCLVDTEGCVHVVGGRFRVHLGQHNPLTPEVFSVGPLWLGVQVESEPELPRRRLGTSPYAHRSAVAGAVDCTGCVDLAQLSDSARQTLLDDAVGAMGSLGYVTNEQLDALELAVSEDGLPPSGLDEISNGTLSNEFTHVTVSDGPVEILDMYPPGGASHLVTPDVGIIRDVRIRGHVTNSDLSTLKITLYTPDPEVGAIVLYDKGQEGTELETTWPTETALVQGSLQGLVGKSLSGTWVFHVVDDGSPQGDGVSPKDGAIESWAVELDTLSGDRVRVQASAGVHGDLEVYGDATVHGILQTGGAQVGESLGVGGDVDVTGDLHVGGVVSGPGGFVVGSGEPVCDAAHAGAIHYDPELRRLVLCDGENALQLRTCEAGCPDPSAVLCGQNILGGCGEECSGQGTKVDSAQCIANQALTACGSPVVDACDNPCGTTGTGVSPETCPPAETVACGETVQDGCDNACGYDGTGLAEALCPAEAELACGVTVVDPCGNDCGYSGSSPALDQCPAAADVSCGQALADPCGNPCPGVGQAPDCPAGFACAEAGCVPDGLSPTSAVASCLQAIETGVSQGSGVYWIDADGAGPHAPFEAWCDMEKEGGGWTLIARYKADSSLAWNPTTHQTLSGGNVGDPPAIWDGTGNYGHIAYTYFDPAGREVRMDCGPINGASMVAYEVATFFDDWSNADKGFYGSPQWGVFRHSGNSRSNHYICGTSLNTANPGAGGLGMCSGTGGSGLWNNHRVSITFSGAQAGCDGKAHHGQMRVWIR